MSYNSLNPMLSGSTSGGVLTDVIALGAMDSHLSLNAQSTYFRSNFSKSSNFAMEHSTMQFNNQPAFGRTVTATIGRTGDLLGKAYVSVTLPGIIACPLPSGGNACGTCCYPTEALGETDDCKPCSTDELGQCKYTNCDKNGQATCADDASDDCAMDWGGVDPNSGVPGPYARFVQAPGLAIIKSANISIGGQVISQLFSVFSYAWEELSGAPGKRLAELIGKRDSGNRTNDLCDLVTDSMSSRTLYIPLAFWFGDAVNLAIPLISLQFHQVQLTIEFEALSKMVVVSGACRVLKCSDGTPLAANDISAFLLHTLYYLDSAERDQFAMGSFSQVITQVQYTSQQTNNKSLKMQLNFNHPCKELIWVVQQDGICARNDTFNFCAPDGKDNMVSAKLLLNNTQRFGGDALYFRALQPHQFHTNVPTTNCIYSYSFALYPECQDYSGSLNFSRIDNISLCLQFACARPYTVYVMARTYNVLKFQEGLGGLAFSN